MSVLKFPGLTKGALRLRKRLFDDAVAEAIRGAIEKNGCTQRELAEACGVGQTSIGHAAEGRGCSAQLARLIATALGVSMDLIIPPAAHDALVGKTARSEAAE